MDGYQLFKKLGFGAKFDFKRFQTDAARLKIVPTKADVKDRTTDEPHQIKSTVQPKQSAKKRKVSTNVGSPKKFKINSSSNNNNNRSGSDDESDDSDAENKVSSDEEDDVDNDDETIATADTRQGSDSDTELHILGSMTSTGKVDREDEIPQKRKKKKKKQSKSNLQDKKMAAMRKQQKIHVTGTDVPPLLSTFDDLLVGYGVHPQIVSNIRQVGYKEPTAIQRQAIPVMLQRRDIMACAPTGSGKTAAFILPILHHLKEPRSLGFRAVVLAPTRELAKQTHREFERLSEGMGFRSYYIEKASSAVKKFGTKSKQKYDIMVTTPNRLVFILQKHPDVLKLDSVEWLVVDESDKLFEEGKNGFRDQLGVIYKACDSTHIRRAMFSATFACDVEEWCKLNLDNVVQVYVGLRNSATETVDQELVFVGSESGKLLAVRQLIQKGIQPPVLVFVQSKDRAKQLFQELIYNGVNVDVIHAERTQQERDNVVKCFRLGQIWVLICTELMGRGIDFKGVNLVINYDFPYSAISYVHRIGRTGRAGRRGRAITYFTEDDSVYLRSIANVMKQAGCPVPDYMLKLVRPSKKRRKRLAHSAPERKNISTKSAYDYEQEKIQREEKMKSLYKKKPRKEKTVIPSGSDNESIPSDSDVSDDGKRVEPAETSKTNIDKGKKSKPISNKSDELERKKNEKVSALKMKKNKSKKKKMKLKTSVSED